MKIVVEDTNFVARSGVSSKTGKAWSLREQKIRVMSDYVRGPSRITLADSQEVYPLGEYELDLEKHVQLDNFGNITLSRQLLLTPVKLQSNLRAA